MDTDQPATPAATADPAATAPTAAEPASLLDLAAPPAGATPAGDPAAPPAKVEGFLNGKYKTAEDFEKGYKELQRLNAELTQKVSTAKPPPEKYELSMPEGIADVTWVEDDPMLAGFQDWAKRNNLPQEAFTEALHMLAKYEYMQEAIDMQQEKAALGERADERLNGFAEWAKANLAEPQFQSIMATLGKKSSPSAVFMALETVLSATRQPSIATPAPDVRSGLTLADVDEMQNKRNEKGQRLVEIDPDYLRRVREARAAVAGTGDFVQVMGRRA